MDHYLEYMPFAHLDNPGWMRFSLLEVVDLFLTHSVARLPHAFSLRPDLYAITHRDTPLYVGCGFHHPQCPGAWRRVCDHISGRSAVGRCIHGSWPVSVGFDIYVGHTPELFPQFPHHIRPYHRKDNRYSGYHNAERALIQALRPVFNVQWNLDPHALPADLTVAPAVREGGRQIRKLRNCLLTNGAVCGKMGTDPISAPRDGSTSGGLATEGVLR